MADDQENTGGEARPELAGRGATELNRHREVTRPGQSRDGAGLTTCEQPAGRSARLNIWWRLEIVEKGGHFRYSC